jgi:hypothetical protein
MTLAEAVAAFEKDFAVSTEVGMADESLPGRRDMSRAPNGQPYIALTSGGVKAEGDRMPAWFASEELAAEAWLTQAWRYADRIIEPGTIGSPLYWREKPELMLTGEFVAIDQAGMMNDPRTRSEITLRLFAVYSRLVVSKNSGKAAA